MTSQTNGQLTLHQLSNSPDQSSYVDMLITFRKRRDEFKPLYTIMDGIPGVFPTLSRAKRCIAVGSGLAQYDAEFINRCLPGLEGLTVVEADASCAEYLRTNLGGMVRGNIECQVVEANAQDWMKSHKQNNTTKADVLIAFHFFYYLNKQERKDFWADCFTNLLNPDGLAFVVHMTDKDRTNILQNIYRNMNGNLFVEAEELRAECVEMGLEIAYAKAYSCTMDLSNLDKASLAFMQHFETEERANQILEVINRLSTDGKGVYHAELFVVRKK